jgi:hypothetical protein
MVVKMVVKIRRRCVSTYPSNRGAPPHYSCMWGRSSEVRHRIPDPDDFNMLANLCSVVR